MDSFEKIAGWPFDNCISIHLHYPTAKKKIKSKKFSISQIHNNPAFLRASKWEIVAYLKDAFRNKW